MKKPSYSLNTTLKLIFCILFKWYYLILTMKKILLIKFIFLLIFTSSCETVKKKSDEIVKKENAKLSKFIGQPVSELKIEMGLPDDEEKSETGSKLLIYETKKYGISCVRKFEIDNNEMVIGFVSKGCF